MNIIRARRIRREKIMSISFIEKYFHIQITKGNLISYPQKKKANGVRSEAFKNSLLIFVLCVFPFVLKTAKYLETKVFAF